MHIDFILDVSRGKGAGHIWHIILSTIVHLLYVFVYIKTNK